MKAFILLALGCLAIVLAESTRFQPVQSIGNSRSEIRTLKELRNHIHLSEDFSLLREGARRSSSGVWRVRMRLQFRGIPIRDVRLQASVDSNGFFTGAVSGQYPVIPDNFDTSPTQGKRRLQKALAEYINDNDDELTGEKVKARELQHFQYEKQIHIDDQGNPQLVYFASALVDRGESDGAYIRYPRVLLRAKNRRPLVGLLRVQKCQGGTACPYATGLDGKSVKNVYGPPSHKICLNASVRKGNKCVLANDLIRVRSVHTSWDRSNANVVSFDCDSGLDSSYEAAADAYYYSQVFYDVIHDWGRLDRTHREPHTLYVNFGESYPNSFWDGVSTTFGDGIDRTYSFVVAEVIGHEMCHAVTDSLGNLVFGSQTSAVNEAFSDICGKALNYYLKGSDAGWGFAYDLMRNPDKSLRYFDDPSRDDCSITHLSQYSPSLDGYTAMGIYTKAFYSIVEGQYIRFRDAFEAFFHANQMYWHEQTGFTDGACGVLKSASDLGLDKNAFINGFNGVGINLDFCDLSGTEDHIVCPDDFAYAVSRHAQISSSRIASYKISYENASSVRVTLCHAGNANTKMTSTCNSGSEIETSDKSYEFPLSAGTTIVLSTNSHEILDVEVTFEFL